MIFDRIKVMTGDVHVTPLHIQLLINYLEVTIKNNYLQVMMLLTAKQGELLLQDRLGPVLYFTVK